LTLSVSSQMPPAPMLPFEDASISWESPLDLDIWSRAATWFEEAREGGGADITTRPAAFHSGPIVGGPAYSPMIYIACHSDPDAKLFRWNLQVTPRPEEEPPEEVLRRSDSVGGIRGIAIFVNDVIGKLPVVAAEYELTVIAKSNGGPLSDFLPRPVSGEEWPGAKIGKSAVLEEIGYRYKDGVMGITEISAYYLNDDEGYMINISANAVLRIGENFQLPVADDIITFVKGQFFNPTRK